MTILEYHPDRAELTVLQSSLADPVYRSQRLGMESITGQAVTTRAPRTEPDLAALPGAADAPIVRLGLAGMVAVPLISRDRAFGTINLYTYDPSTEPAEAAPTPPIAGMGARAADLGQIAEAAPTHAAPFPAPPIAGMGARAADLGQIAEAAPTHAAPFPAPPIAGMSARAADLTIRSIGPAETGLLEAFAAQAAVAIDNARLHKEEIARQRLEQELEVGRQIQLSMLPKCCPDVPGWQIVSYYQPARSVGGDFYDLYELPGKPGRLGLVIADVADHGVGAALLMALSRTIIRTVALAGRGPASALTRANTLILKDSHADTFISAVYAALEPETGRLIYANAGHVRPLWYHAAAGTVTELALRGIVLGAFEEIQLKEERIDLEHGDALVFYTDGVTEAENAAGEQFGDGRLREVVAAHGHASAEDLLRAVVEAVAAWAGAREWGDDVTGVVVKRRGGVR